MGVRNEWIDGWKECWKWWDNDCFCLKNCNFSHNYNSNFHIWRAITAVLASVMSFHPLSLHSPYPSLSSPLPLHQAFDQSELLECIRRLVEIDQDWVPTTDESSLYIRPTFIGTEVRRIMKCYIHLWRQKLLFFCVLFLGYTHTRQSIPWPCMFDHKVCLTSVRAPYHAQAPCSGTLLCVHVSLAALFGRKEARPCLAVCDLESGGRLLQCCGGPVLVGWPEVHAGLERRNWRLQDGRVGKHILYECYDSLIIQALNSNIWVLISHQRQVQIKS